MGLYLALYLPWSVHGACTDHLFSMSLWHVFYSDITWTCTHKFPPVPPRALLTRMAGTMQRTSNAIWMGDNAMGWLVAVWLPFAKRPPVASHAPRLSHPTCPTHRVPCAPPIASHCPRHRVPHGHAVVSHTSVSLHASQPQCAARPC